MPKPEFSAGARCERKAFREYLRRRIKPKDSQRGTPEDISTLESVLMWVKGRQSRYDKKEGGL